MPRLSTTLISIRRALPDEVIWSRRNESYSKLADELGVNPDAMRRALAYKWTWGRTGRLTTVPCAECGVRRKIERVNDDRLCEKCRPEPVKEDPPWLDDYRWGLEIAKRRRKQREVA